MEYERLVHVYVDAISGNVRRRGWHRVVVSHDIRAVIDDVAERLRARHNVHMESVTEDADYVRYMFRRSAAAQ
jgi:hypothetical protein